MKIHLTDTTHGVIWWSSLNYKRQEIHKVAYGLQVKEFTSERAAALEVAQCIDHAIQCNDPE